MMKDVIKPELIFSADYGVPTQGFNSISVSNNASTGRKNKKLIKAKGEEKQSHLRNSFIQKLTKKKEVEMSEETAASIGMNLGYNG